MRREDRPIAALILGEREKWDIRMATTTPPIISTLMGILWDVQPIVSSPPPLLSRLNKI